MRVRAQVPQDQAGFFFIFVNLYFIFVNSYLELSIFFLICNFLYFSRYGAMSIEHVQDGDRGNYDLDFYQVGGQYVDHSHDRDRKRFKGKVVALCNVPLQAGVT